jgi:hypothetical protein
VYFPKNVLMVYSPKPIVITDGNNLTGTEFARGETIYFWSMEFIIDRFGNPSFSPQGNDSGVLLLGMVHSGLPSLDVILEESFGEDDSALSEGEAPASPFLKVAMW